MVKQESLSEPQEAPRTSGVESHPSDLLEPPGARGDGPEGGVGAVEGEPLPRDLWRDRIRVIRDGLIYLVVATAAYKLRMADKLDPATAGLLLLIAGVRAHNIADFVASRKVRNAAGAVLIAKVPVDTFRGFFRS